MNNTDDTKRQILRVARSEFGEHGYHGTSMSRIAAACDIKKSSLYHFFSGKSALYCAAVSSVVEEIQETFAGDGAPTEEKFKKTIEKSIRAGLNHGQLVFPPSDVVKEIPEEELKKLKEQMDTVKRVTISFMKKYDVPNPAFASQLLRDANLMFIHRVHADRAENSIKTHVAHLADILLP